MLEIVRLDRAIGRYILTILRWQLLQPFNSLSSDRLDNVIFDTLLAK
jgi:hypothetical protein